MIELHLAPMEGIVDAVVRRLWTEIGGFDLCVTEFIRITSTILPERVYQRYCPELSHDCRTSAGVPVVIQLLGGDANCVAENAAQAVGFGACGIDLNFGCPAPTVNRHDGGATLLQYPERIFSIVSAVRAAVPAAVPVSAKIRLGFNDTGLCFEIAQATERGGAGRLTVHCRTKKDLYRPPAFWEWIPLITSRVKIPVVANGEIWSREDFEKCRAITGVSSFMIGRGAISNPFLAREIRGTSPARWERIAPLLPMFFDASAAYRHPSYAIDRSKMFLRFLSRRFPEAGHMFQTLKVIRSPQDFRAQLTCRHEESLSL